ELEQITAFGCCSRRLAVTRAAQPGVQPGWDHHGVEHGTTIFAQCFEGRRARNAQAQTRYAQERKKRKKRKKGEKPQAGHCYRPLGSSQKREKGPAQGPNRPDGLSRVLSSPRRPGDFGRAPRMPW